MKKRIHEIFKESIDVKRDFVESQAEKIQQAAEEIIGSLKRGGKVILFGNGGSAADSQHIAGELVGRFKLDRRALPAMALTTNSSTLTALSNDYGYEYSFVKQIEAFAHKGDVVIAISTSGNSSNVVKAVETSKKLGLKTIAFSGGDGGKLAKLADIPIVVSSRNTPRIQESHITLGHVICELVERELFKDEAR